MTFGNYVLATTGFYIYISISKMILLCFCTSFARKHKEHVKSVDPEIGKDMDEVENISAIVSAMVEQRTSLGLSQRELASMCGIAQSSVARIESCKTVPSLDTLLNIFRHLGLQLTVTPTKSTI